MATRRRTISPIAYIVISAIGLLLSFFLLFTFARQLPDLVRLGMSRAFLYVIMLPLGLATSAFLFGALRSTASFRGQVLSGTIELGGPIVACALVIVGCFYFIKSEVPQQTFFVKTRFHQQSGAPATGGVVKLLIRNATYTQPIDPQGEAVFNELPFEFWHKSASLSYDSFDEQLPSIAITLDQDNPPNFTVVSKPRPPAPPPPPVVFEDTIEEVRSPRAVEAWGSNWSPEELFCTSEKPPDWTIVHVSDVHLESATERGSCGPWTVCGGSQADTPRRVCRTLRVQGHNENRFDGWGRAVLSFNVTWHHPK
jgi:hypothetical protein